MPIPSFDAQIADQVAPEIVERMQSVAVQEPEPFTPSAQPQDVNSAGTGEQLPPPTDQLQQTYESMVGGTAINTKPEMPKDSILDTPDFIETVKATYQRESIIGSVATFGFSQDQKGEWTSDGWNPYQHFAQNDQYKDLLPELREGAFDNALNPEMFANIAEKVRKEKDLLHTMEDGPIAGVLTGGALSMLDIVSLVPAAGGASKLRLAGRIGLRATEGAGLMASQEAALHAMQQQRTVTESFLNVGFGAAIGGAFGAFHPKSALNPKNTKSPLVDEKLIEEEGLLVAPMGKTLSEGGNTMPGASLGAARSEAHESQIASTSAMERFDIWRKFRLDKLTGITAATPVGRAVRAASAKARETMAGILDLGGTLTKGMTAGKAHRASAEDLAMDYKEPLKDEIYQFSRHFSDMQVELGRGFGDKLKGAVNMTPVTKSLLMETIRRKLVDDLHQFGGQWRPNNQQWFELEMKRIGLDPEVAGPIVHKYSDDIVKDMHAKNIALEQKMIEHGLIDPDKGLGKGYGLPQLWRHDWITDNREEARRFFMEVFAKRPDEAWLRENYDMSLADFQKLASGTMTETAADGTKKTIPGRAEILEQWAGDAHDTAVALARVQLDAATQKAAMAEFELREILHAQKLVAADHRKATMAEVKAAARSGILKQYGRGLEIALAKSELAASNLEDIERRLANAIGIAEDAAKTREPLGDLLDQQGPLVAGARSDVSLLNAGLKETRENLKLASDPAEIAALKAERDAAKVALREARAVRDVAIEEFRATAKNLKQLQRWIDAGVREAEKRAKEVKTAKELEGLEREHARHQAATDKLQQKLDAAREARKAAWVEVQNMRTAGKMSRADARKATKAMRKAARAAEKAAKRKPMVDAVDELLEAMANRERFPSGLMDHDIVEATGRAKERRIHLTPQERARAEGLGMLDQDLFRLRDRMYTDIGGRLALLENFGSVGLTAQKKEIRQEYAEMIDALQTKLRTVPMDGAEAKRLQSDIADLMQESKVIEEDIDGTVKRILGQQLVATDPESFITWGMGKLIQASFIRAGFGFILSAMPDIGALLLQTGATRKLFPALKESMKAIKGTGLAKDSPELRRIVESMEVIFHSSRQARTNALDIPEYRYGIGAPGTAKNTATGAVDRVMTWASEMVGKWNILQYWNRSLKGAAALVQLAQMAEMLPKYAKLSDLDKAKFASLGIEESSATRLGELFEKYGTKHGELFDPRADKWVAEADGEEMHRILRVAVRRLQDRAIPTPGVGDTPLFMSKPAGRLIGQFSSLGYKYLNTFLTPGAQRLMIYRDHDVLTAYATALTLGSMATAVRGFMNGKEPSDYSAQQWVVESLDRAGFFAYTSPYQDAFTKLFGPSVNSALGVDLFKPTARYSRNRWWESLMGPWLGTIGTAGQAASELAGGDLAKARDKAILLAPFNQVYRLGSAINDSLTE
jgi:hypothetical protein